MGSLQSTTTYHDSYRVQRDLQKCARHSHAATLLQKPAHTTRGTHVCACSMLRSMPRCSGPELIRASSNRQHRTASAGWLRVAQRYVRAAAAHQGHKAPVKTLLYGSSTDALQANCQKGRWKITANWNQQLPHILHFCSRWLVLDHLVDQQLKRVLAEHWQRPLPRSTLCVHGLSLAATP
jgi:hypothetical protein